MRPHFLLDSAPERLTMAAGRGQQVELRSEKRLVIALPVRVYGMTEGKPFSQAALTLDITRDGARLEGLPHLPAGEVVGLQYGPDRARYKVIWVGEVGGKREGQIGLQVVQGFLAQWHKILDATPEELRELDQVFKARAAKVTSF